MDMPGREFTPIVAVLVLLHPVTVLVPCTVYVVAVVGLNIILLFTEEGLYHEQLFPPDPVKVACEPLHIVPAPDMDIVGGAPPNEIKIVLVLGQLVTELVPTTV